MNIKLIDCGTQYDFIVYPVGNGGILINCFNPQTQCFCLQNFRLFIAYYDEYNGILSNIYMRKSSNFDTDFANLNFCSSVTPSNAVVSHLINMQPKAEPIGTDQAKIECGQNTTDNKQTNMDKNNTPATLRHNTKLNSDFSWNC